MGKTSRMDFCFFNPPNGRMDNLQLYVFNIISVISGRSESDNIKVHVLDLCMYNMYLVRVR